MADVKPQAFKTLELNEGDGLNRQFGHTYQVKSALYSITETGNSQSGLNYVAKHAVLTQQNCIYFCDNSKSHCFPFCFFIRSAIEDTHRDVYSLH